MTLCLISRNHIHFWLFIQNFYHVPDNFRILLKISVNDRNIGSGGILQSCINGRFFTEISGKVHYQNVAVFV